MQHLPLPEDCISEAVVKVPYIGHVQYDEGGFFGYLDRKGIQEADIIDFRCQEEHVALKLSYLQEWLFFGALHEFATLSDVSLDLKSSIEADGESATWITTLPLKDFASRLVYTNAKAFTPSDWTSRGISESWSDIVSHRPIFMVAGLSSNFVIPQELQRERRQKVGRLLRKACGLDIWQDSLNNLLTSP